MGYLNFASTKPNAGHSAVAEIEQSGRCHGIITQNVDGYHQDAGAKNVIELHGNLHYVKCLDCHSRVPRAEFQERMIRENQKFYDANLERSRSGNRFPDENTVPVMKPDGDIELVSEDFANFVLPRCSSCDSINVQPDIVFMGGNVDPEIAEKASQWVEEADGLLVLGSTLTVYSSFRLAKHIKRREFPLAIVNRGVTRADPIADIKIEEGVTDTLHYLLRHATL